MKFGGFIAVTSEKLIYREHQFIGIYTFNCRDLRWPLLISRAAPATPQKYRVSGETRMVKTSNSFSFFFLQRPACYRVSRFGANRTSIIYIYIYMYNPLENLRPDRIHGRRAVFSRIRRKPRGQPHRRGNSFVSAARL